MKSILDGWGTEASRAALPFLTILAQRRSKSRQEMPAPQAAGVSLLVSKGEEAAMQKRKFDGDEVACLDRTRRNHQPGYHGDPGASLDRGRRERLRSMGARARR